MANDYERRKHKRVAVKLPLQLKKGAVLLDGNTADVSIGGICVHTSKAIPLNSKVYVTLSVPKEEKQNEIRVIGKVVRAEEISLNGNATMALGIEFKDISNENLMAIKDLLKGNIIQEELFSYEKPDNVDLQMGDDKSEANPQAVENEGASENFFSRFLSREDLSDILISSIKWLVKGVIFVLLFYASYNVTLLAIKLIKFL